MSNNRSGAGGLAPVLAMVSAILVHACGTEESNQPPPPPPPARTVAKASPSGDAQTGEVQTALASPLRVIVTNDGSPEAGVTVNWSGSGTGVAFSPSSSTTGADGVAETTWTLPEEAGNATASAAVSEAGGSPVSFSATAQAAAPIQVTMLDGDDQVGGVGTEAGEAMSVTVSDQFGNGVTGVSVTWAVTSGSGSVSPTNTTTAGGIASSTLTFGSSTGPVTVTATAGALGSVSFTAIGGILVNVQANETFSPNSLTVDAGDYVVWLWTSGSVTHTVTPDPPGTEPPDSSPPVSFPASYVHQFNNPGTYDYHCTVHGSPGVGMIGTVIVQ